MFKLNQPIIKNKVLTWSRDLTGTMGLEDYLRMSVDTERISTASPSGTVTNVTDYTDVSWFE